MKRKKFKAELLSGHKGAAVQVPFDPATTWAIDATPLWPGRRGYLVRGELNGVSFGSCIVPRSRKFWMLVDEEVQKKAGASVGDEVRITIEPVLESESPLARENRVREGSLSKARATKAQRKAKPLTFETVRQLALALPGVEEGTSYGTPAFKVSGKLLARLHQDGESLVVKVEYAAREVLMGANPRTFYITEHYRCWPWILVRISSVDINELRGLLEDAWRRSAPKRRVAAWESSSDL